MGFRIWAVDPVTFESLMVVCLSATEASQSTKHTRTLSPSQSPDYELVGTVWVLDDLRTRAREGDSDVLDDLGCGEHLFMRCFSREEVSVGMPECHLEDGRCRRIDEVLVHPIISNRTSWTEVTYQWIALSGSGIASSLLLATMLMYGGRSPTGTTTPAPSPDCNAFCATSLSIFLFFVACSNCPLEEAGLGVMTP